MCNRAMIIIIWHTSNFKFKGLPSRIIDIIRRTWFSWELELKSTQKSWAWWDQLLIWFLTWWPSLRSWVVNAFCNWRCLGGIRPKIALEPDQPSLIECKLGSSQVGSSSLEDSGHTVDTEELHCMHMLLCLKHIRETSQVWCRLWL